MRILILSQDDSPEPIPKPAELARALKENGHDVSVITGIPNYPSGVVYNGYRKKLIHRETLDGVPVVRTFEYPYHGKRALGRFANYLSFMISAPLGLLFSPKADVMYVWHPPLTIGIAAWIIARLRRIPFVYDVQDIWPEAAVLSGIMKPGFTVRCLSFLERFVYRRADHLIVVTEGAKKNLVLKGIAPSKISALPHWIDDGLFHEADASLREEIRLRNGWEGRFVVLFAGNMGIVQGLETVIQAAEMLRARPSVLFAFIGDGSDRERLKQLAASLGLDGVVQFIDRQPMEKMPAFFAGADALIVHLKDSELSDYVIPSKTMAYLAAGRPIIMAMNGAAADVVAAAGAGLITEPESPEQLAAAVETLSAMCPEERAVMGSKGRNYLAAHFSEKIVLPAYLTLLQDMISQRR